MPTLLACEFGDCRRKVRGIDVVCWDDCSFPQKSIHHHSIQSSLIAHNTNINIFEPISTIQLLRIDQISRLLHMRRCSSRPCAAVINFRWSSCLRRHGDSHAENRCQNMSIIQRQDNAHLQQKLFHTRTHKKNTKQLNLEELLDQVKKEASRTSHDLSSSLQLLQASTRHRSYN